MTEPFPNGGNGGALTVDFGRRVTRSLRLVALGIGSRASNDGNAGAARYDYDREWLIAALGVETPLVRTPRAELTAGLQGGASWSRMRRFTWIGTPPPGEPQSYSTRKWDEGAVMVPSLHLTYRVNGPLAVSTRLANVSRIFTDDMFGDWGILLSFGANLAW